MKAKRFVGVLLGCALMLWVGDQPRQVFAQESMQGEGFSATANELEGGCAATVAKEVEQGVGDGTVMSRGSASGKKSVLLHAGESRTMSMSIGSCAAGYYRAQVRTSNDQTPGIPSEVLVVFFDGALAGGYRAPGVSGGGSEWNHFIDGPLLAPRYLSAGTHQVTVVVVAGDTYYGIELDLIRLVPVS